SVAGPSDEPEYRQAKQAEETDRTDDTESLSRLRRVGHPLGLLVYSGQGRDAMRLPRYYQLRDPKPIHLLVVGWSRQLHLRMMAKVEERWEQVRPKRDANDSSK